MKTTKNYIFAVFMALMSASGCAAFQVGTDVEAGRKAFLIGDNERALGYFRSAAQMDPDYVYYGMGLRQNIWSYVGRSEYAAGRLAEARQTLEKALVPSGDENALSSNGDQDMARLYLGLTLARSGDQQRGLKEIAGGMRGIHDGIEYVTQAFRSPSAGIGIRGEKFVRPSKGTWPCFRGKTLTFRNSSAMANGWGRQSKRKSIWRGV